MTPLPAFGWKAESCRASDFADYRMRIASGQEARAVNSGESIDVSDARVFERSRSGPPRSLPIVAVSALLLACPASPKERLDALLEPLRSDRVPGAAVMVIRDGAVVYSATLGLADVERRIPIGPRTAFDIASVSKQFTAMLAMILHEEGRLDYDTPVVDVLPELSRFGAGLTVRHLLMHTSGLPDYYEALAASSAPGRWVDNREALAFLARRGD